MKGVCGGRFLHFTRDVASYVWGEGPGRPGAWGGLDPHKPPQTRWLRFILFAILEARSPRQEAVGRGPVCPPATAVPPPCLPRPHLHWPRLPTRPRPEAPGGHAVGGRH